MIVSPDAGGVYRAKKFREGLAQKYDVDAGLAMIIKQRARANEVRGAWVVWVLVWVLVWVVVWAGVGDTAVGGRTYACTHDSLSTWHDYQTKCDAMRCDAIMQVDRMDLVGSVVDSDVVIVDDMIDTAGTLGKAADVLVANGGELAAFFD